MKKGIIIGVAVAAILAIAAVVFLIVLPGMNPKPHTTEVVKKEEFEFKIGEMYTNLADEGKICKINLVLKYALTEEEVAKALIDHPPAAGGHGGPVAATGPIDAVFEEGISAIKNDILSLFREKTYGDLMKPNAQKRLREEIKQLIVEGTGVKSETIADVFFVELIVQ